MKKRDLVKKLKSMAREAGFELVFEGGSKHDKYRVNGEMIVVPRHKEINEITAQEILKDLAEALGE